MSRVGPDLGAALGALVERVGVKRCASGVSVHFSNYVLRTGNLKGPNRNPLRPRLLPIGRPVAPRTGVRAGVRKSLLTSVQDRLT